ncbi:hypothetical protein PG997_012547 [Apiospora hydei]|uniref:Transmembrane protein n=1 Tax=Apiospora hydei TaxID=1337664 RepID=A0ABR1V3N7_9PEZI
MDDDHNNDATVDWTDQVARFPTRTTNTEKVQDWLYDFLKRRTFNDREIEAFVLRVWLDGEDIHTLSKDELDESFPRSLFDYGLEASPYRFDQMHRDLLTDVIRARKQRGFAFIKSSIGSRILDMPVVAWCRSRLYVIASCLGGMTCIVALLRALIWALRWVLGGLMDRFLFA